MWSLAAKLNLALMGVKAAHKPASEVLKVFTSNLKEQHMGNNGF